MSSLRKLLVATDFSPHSRRAVGMASELSGRLGVPLVVMNAVQIPMYPIPDGVVLRAPEVMTELVDRARRTLEDECKVAADLGAQDVEAQWVEGPPAAEIVRLAKELDVDLILVGSHGRGALARAILGSTADKVVRTAHCAVMVVTHEPHH
jgi:nucleotide-binding universal stress UspA family protein